LSESVIKQESQQAVNANTLGKRVEEKKVSETVGISKENDPTSTTRNISTVDSKPSVDSKSQDNKDSLESTSNQKPQNGADQEENLMIWRVNLLNGISPSKKPANSQISSGSFPIVSELNDEEQTNYQNFPLPELDNNPNPSEVTVADISQ
jgi:hypothetical protein